MKFYIVFWCIFCVVVDSVTNGVRTFYLINLKSYDQLNLTRLNQINLILSHVSFFLWPTFLNLMMSISPGERCGKHPRLCRLSVC